jgi:hypothetical protein
MSAHRLPYDLAVAPYEKADPGTGNAVVVDRWNAQIPLTIAAGVAETNTLATPIRPGQKLTLVAASVGSGGSRAVTAASAVNQTENTVMTFGAERQIVAMESIPVGSGDYRWQIIVNEGSVSLS